MMKQQSNMHVHTPGDGRGPRQAYPNGKPLYYVVYANTKTGKAVVSRYPLRLDKWRKRVLTKTVRGHIEVSQL